MRPHVAQDVGRPGNLRVYPPFGGGGVLLHGDIVETVGKLHIYDTDLPKQAFLDQLPCFLDHLMPGISIGDADDLVLLFGNLLQFLRFFYGEA